MDFSLSLPLSPPLSPPFSLSPPAPSNKRCMITNTHTKQLPSKHTRAPTDGCEAVFNQKTSRLCSGEAAEAGCLQNVGTNDRISDQLQPIRLTGHQICLLLGFFVLFFVYFERHPPTMIALSGPSGIVICIPLEWTLCSISAAAAAAGCQWTECLFGRKYTGKQWRKEAPYRSLSDRHLLRSPE